MGLTKQYLRFLPAQVLNAISVSNTANCCILPLKGQHGKYIASPAAQNVIIWDFHTRNEVSLGPTYLSDLNGC
jgi:hypothetical protein